MPRAKRQDGRANNGGPRQGNPGTAYQNRSDLRGQKPTAAPGQEYGKAGAQLAAQAAVPMAGAPAPASAPTGPAAAQAAAAAYQMPSFGAFDRPTERPDEALTHGAPVGPGAGPEVMPGNDMGGPTGMSGMLRSIAGAVGSSDLEALAARAESLGH
jgi:hypothetical protein